MSQTLSEAVKVSVHGPDAGLVAVCSEFCASEIAFCALYDAQSNDDDRENIADGAMRGWSAMLDRMAELQATTKDGLAARALALAQHAGIKPGFASYALAFVPNEGVAGRLLHMLLVDAVRMSGSPPPDPDADLLALRPEFDRLHAVMIAYNTTELIPDGEGECAAFDALCNRVAMATPATSTEGRAFQAAAAMHNLTYRVSEDDLPTDPVWLMLQGIAGDAYQSTDGRAR